MAKRKSRKNKINLGLKALGEKDILVGIALLVLGGVLATAPKVNGMIWFVASVLTIFGVILTGFGINDYLRK